MPNRPGYYSLLTPAIVPGFFVFDGKYPPNAQRSCKRE